MRFARTLISQCHWLYWDKQVDFLKQRGLHCWKCHLNRHYRHWNPTSSTVTESPPKTDPPYAVACFPIVNRSKTQIPHPTSSHSPLTSKNGTHITSPLKLVLDHHRPSHLFPSLNASPRSPASSLTLSVRTNTAGAQKSWPSCKNSGG